MSDSNLSDLRYLIRQNIVGITLLRLTVFSADISSVIVRNCFNILRESSITCLSYCVREDGALFRWL